MNLYLLFAICLHLILSISLWVWGVLAIKGKNSIKIKLILASIGKLIFELNTMLLALFLLLVKDLFSEIKEEIYLEEVNIKSANLSEKTSSWIINDAEYAAEINNIFHNFTHS